MTGMYCHQKCEDQREINRNRIDGVYSITDGLTRSKLVYGTYKICRRCEKVFTGEGLIDSFRCFCCSCKYSTSAKNNKMRKLQLERRLEQKEQSVKREIAIMGVMISN